MEDIHFYRTFGTIPYRGTSTDIEHTIISMPVERDMNCIDTIGRNQLIRIVYTEIGRRESDFPSYLITAHHRTIQKIVVTQTTCSPIYFALMQHLTNDRRAYMEIITHTGTSTNHLYSHFRAITAIILKAFTTIVSEAVVISDDKCLHPITVSQDIGHKFMGSQM